MNIVWNIIDILNDVYKFLRSEIKFMIFIGSLFVKIDDNVCW